VGEGPGSSLRDTCYSEKKTDIVSAGSQPMPLVAFSAKEKSVSNFESSQLTHVIFEIDLGKRQSASGTNTKEEGGLPEQRPRFTFSSGQPQHAWVMGTSAFHKREV